MAKYHIHGNKVVAKNSLIPLQYQEVEGEDYPSLALSDLYFEGAEVKPIPTKTSPDQVWTGTEWITPTPDSPMTFPVYPNFTGLFESFRGTELWSKIKVAGTKSLRLNLAVTMLIAALTASKSEVGLEESLVELRAALVDSTQTTDFTADEITEINSLLTQYSFDLKLN